MRPLHIVLLSTLISVSLAAQPARPRPGRIANNALAAENALKQAAEELAGMKKIIERDLDVLRRLRAADEALVDAMQPSVALQTAFEQVEKAKSLQPEFTVMQGVIRSLQELEGARRSPGTADFGRLRSILREEALGPASRVAVRNALRLQEEATGWIRVQEQVTAHLRALSEISSESLRESQR